jgi:hypothetical protein
MALRREPGNGMGAPLDLRVALPAQEIPSPEKERLILACMGFVALQAFPLHHGLMGTLSLKGALVMTEKADLSGRRQKELLVVRLVHFMARVACAHAHRRVNRGSVKILGLMAGITQVRSRKVQQLRLISLVGLMASGAHAAHDGGMDIRLCIILRLVMAVEANILGEKHSPETAHMGVVATGTHACLDRHVHGICSRKLALVVARKTQGRRLGHESPRGLGAEGVRDLCRIDPGMTRGTSHGHRGMHSGALCLVRVTHSTVHILRICNSGERERDGNQCGQNNKHRPSFHGTSYLRV